MTDTGPCGEPATATNRIRVTRDDPGLRPNRRVQLRRRALGRTTEDRYRRVWPGCRHRDRALRPFPGQGLTTIPDLPAALAARRPIDEG
jgi:hypothetical protein